MLTIRQIEKRRLRLAQEESINRYGLRSKVGFLEFTSSAVICFCFLLSIHDSQQNISWFHKAKLLKEMIEVEKPYSFV